MFTQADRHRLLTIARGALEARVRGERAPAPETGGALDTPCGAFVSIHRLVELRGCLGRLEADWPIARVVAQLGRAVADADPRFPPVAIDELAVLSMEISALGPERTVRSAEEVEIGRHGVIVEQGPRRGLLLPQVAIEHAWDAETFLDHACLKAGLAPDAWRHGASLAVFDAQVFGERDASWAALGG